jgi:hypothetical protein
MHGLSCILCGTYCANKDKYKLSYYSTPLATNVITSVILSIILAQVEGRILLTLLVGYALNFLKADAMAK